MVMRVNRDSSVDIAVNQANIADKLKNYSERVSTTVVPVAAARGVIYDQKGKVTDRELPHTIDILAE
jgi:hypothetical protein